MESSVFYDDTKSVSQCAVQTSMNEVDSKALFTDSDLWGYQQERQKCKIFCGADQIGERILCRQQIKRSILLTYDVQAIPKVSSALR